MTDHTDDDEQGTEIEETDATMEELMEAEPAHEDGEADD